jgi:hypothetical protein
MQVIGGPVVGANGHRDLGLWDHEFVFLIQYDLVTRTDFHIAGVGCCDSSAGTIR